MYYNMGQKYKSVYSLSDQSLLEVAKLVVLAHFNHSLLYNRKCTYIYDFKILLFQRYHYFNV